MFTLTLKRGPVGRDLRAHRRIFVAEDNAALAGFVRKGLEAEPYAVDVSARGEQARALACESTTTAGEAARSTIRSLSQSPAAARKGIRDRQLREYRGRRLRRDQRSLDDPFSMRREFVRRER